MRGVPGLGAEGPLLSSVLIRGVCHWINLGDTGMSHWGHTRCLPTMTLCSPPQAGPPDPPPGRGSTGGILQGTGCHCFCQVPTTGSSPAPLPTPRRACLSQEHDRRGGSCPHLCPGAASPPAWHSHHHSSPRAGAWLHLLCIQGPLPLRRPELQLPGYLKEVGLLATPGWALGSGSPRYQRPRSKRGGLLGSMVSLRTYQGSWVMAR